MFEQMKWEDVYELWKNGAYYFSKTLTGPVSAETVMVKYEQKSGFIYGYDWLENAHAEERKQLIQQNPTEFLYFTKPSNKGTSQTAEMLIEAQNEEELAAIWIAATTKELCERRIGGATAHYADILHMAACSFLGTRYFLWHHAMTKLVPEIMIPPTVIDNIVCKDANPIIGLVQLNTVLLKGSWRILRYSSLKDGESEESYCHIRRDPFKAN